MWKYLNGPFWPSSNRIKPGNIRPEIFCNRYLQDDLQEGLRLDLRVRLPVYPTVTGQPVNPPLFYGKSSQVIDW